MVVVAAEGMVVTCGGCRAGRIAGGSSKNPNPEASDVPEPSLTNRLQHQPPATPIHHHNISPVRPSPGRCSSLCTARPPLSPCPCPAPTPKLHPHPPPQNPRSASKHSNPPRCRRLIRPSFQKQSLKRLAHITRMIRSRRPAHLHQRSSGYYPPTTSLLSFTTTPEHMPMHESLSGGHCLFHPVVCMLQSNDRPRSSQHRGPRANQTFQL